MKPSSSKAEGTVRCAIYTRKSSDEGLEQSFNSLHAQREACAAYILSQASEGWTEIAEVYDDGGLSGGTLERPALQRLLADVAAGRIDIIVVYKVDRLTRSLLDFSRLVEAFDKAGTSFVSITQSFNTTTSMGRLTLNMLLSFAQFEREVTAERIRDKIAASKAKGMWMGGVPPVGYRPDGRSLAVVAEHADLVRHLFARYLALGAVRLLEAELKQARVRVPERTTTSGRPIGGGLFTRGQLYHLLKNVIYTGQIAHKDKVHPGQHPAIVDRDTFERAQALLASHVQGRRAGGPTSPPASSSPQTSPLAGRIVDGAGEPLLAVHANKGATRYRYYVSRDLHHGTGGRDGGSRRGLRIPAREIESLVAERLAALFADPLLIAAEAWLDVPASRLGELDAHCRETKAELERRQSPLLPRLVQQVRIGDAGVEIICAADAIAAAAAMPLHADAPATLTLASSARITRSGHAIRLVRGDGGGSGQAPDRALVRLILRARGWWATLRAEGIGVTELAEREGVTRSYLCRVVRLAFLSPAVVEAILAGRQRVGVTVAALMPEDAVAPSWREQAQALLPG